ncbi:transcription elongation factor, mitochondrial isoform X3 [Strongylocentrotus purpuratus]|uniref:Transcription elongation factor, mitochondrial n=1 Tax=Strongylocentrotus purpuratus TaxID=7668 RepID=A0A7M7NR70_STRPU|nr:transcription elongation factor, mitochondrial isoform X3 [Strongylocentrotus purpuratus]
MEMDNFPPYLLTKEEGVSLKRRFEMKSGINFVRSSNYRAPNEKEMNLHFVDKNKVVCNNEYPYSIINTDTYECMYGRERHAARKKRLLEEPRSPSKRAYNGDHASRKKGCPAKLILKEVVMYTDFKLDDAMSDWKKKLIGRDLRSALNTKANLNKEVRIYVKYPLDEDHLSGHEAYQKPASTCSSSSNHSILSALEVPGALELGEEVEVEYHETTLTPADQTEKLVNVLNSAPESELKMVKYINSKMAAGIIAHREEKGQISRLEELLVIPGVGRRILDKLLTSFANGKQEKTRTRIDPQSTSHTELSNERLSSLKDVVAIDVGLKHIAWLHMDKDRWVHNWHCKMIEGISPGKWDPINYLRFISDTVEEMPRPDLYVLEHKSFTSLNKGTFQTMLFVRCLESMLYTRLNSDIIETGQAKAISLPQNVVGRHFDLLVGTQRKSGQALARALLEEGVGMRNAWYPVRIGYENMAIFCNVNKYKREHLANCLLRATAFYDIHIDKKPGFKLT